MSMTSHDKTKRLQNPEKHGFDPDSPATQPADGESTALKQSDVTIRRPRVSGPNRRSRKEQVTIFLSPEVLKAFRATGRNWQTQVNEALQEWLKTHPCFPGPK
jgi:uncharacterized protein (DUF4415 family)